MTSVLTILGGSSPFVTALIDAIRDRRPPIAPRGLVLHGRDPCHLDLVARYARSQLGRMGWAVRTTADLDDALDGTSVVIHQIRYGGMEQRAADERFAEAHGLAADETLGPAGLRAAIRMAPALIGLAARFRRRCPEAWVLNLTNPLSVATALLCSNGVHRCVGLCELPLVTVEGACHTLGLRADEVEWSYSGLNHRGFLHKLTSRGRDLLAELPLALGKDRLGGIGADEIAELGAVPLKYFRLIHAQGPGGGGRAAYLADLRVAILEELRRDGSNRPPSLRRRSMEWYPRSVVPMLAALDAGDGRTEVVNVPGGDGIIEEVRARVFADRIEALPVPRPGAAVSRWLEIFSTHERAVLGAALRPTRGNIEEALAADPCVPSESVGPLAAALCVTGPSPELVGVRR